MRAPRLDPERAKGLLFGSFVFSVAYVVSFVPIPAMDFFWQVATGRYVLRHGVPHADPFSHTMFGKPWTAHEWLSCVLFALCFDKLGPDATLKVKALICALSMLTVYLACRARGASQWASLLSSLLCTLVLRPFFDLRPQVLTYLMLAILLLLAAKALREGRPWRVFLFLPLQALWANLHGAFVLGPVFLALLALGLLPSGRRREAAAFGSLALACVVLSLANPYGPRLLLYPLGYVGARTVHARAIVEWQSPDFHSPHFWPFEALLLALFALGPVAARRGKVELAEILVLLPFLHFALLMRRHIPIFALLSAPVLARWLAGVVGWRLHPSGKHAAPAVYVLASLVLLAPLPFLPLKRGAFERYAVLSNFPVKAANWLKGRGLPERLFNPYDWGGYLIFKLWPEYRVFVDGRADLYGEFVVRDYREALGPRWKEVFERYRVGTAVVRPGTEIFRRLLASKDWAEVYRDRVAAVFVRRSGRTPPGRGPATLRP